MDFYKEMLYIVPHAHFVSYDSSYSVEITEVFSCTEWMFKANLAIYSHKTKSYHIQAA